MLKPRELYYITHFNNLPSILEKGILCHRKVEEEKINFTPIYDAEIVSSRKEREVADGRSLWDFANLYFQPRNAMLYRVVFSSGINIEDILIIGLKSNILNRSDIYVTNGNAASSNTEFFSLNNDNAQKLLETIIKKTDKKWWASEDGSKRELMAECLVPDKVSPDYISEIYVPNENALNKVKKIYPTMSVIPEPELFFLPSRRIPLTDHLSLVEGDMFFSRMQTLTISVNTIGVMGKGLASRAKYQFPDVYVKYQDLCKDKTLRMGKPYLYKREGSLDFILTDEAEKLTNLNLQTWFLLFPTKTDWRKKADLKGIEEGLDWLVQEYKKEDIKSLAIPALGCGLGRLTWGEVGPILCTYLSQLTIPVSLYLPLESKIPEDQLKPDFLIRE
ncbi:DarT ssDNA thymidine ADP-ribosyltransferase family protein [Caldisericum sp.]|uniref:DarT ssDNA thymidine ADP-ribosyltransferase family protein n=1 Tax=Caldisericum sp. TaxID=2499687 RepID=UPI003D1270A7